MRKMLPGRRDGGLPGKRFMQIYKGGATRCANRVLCEILGKTPRCRTQVQRLRPFPRDRIYIDPGDKDTRRYYRSRVTLEHNAVPYTRFVCNDVRDA